MCGEGIEFVEFVRHQHLAEGLILTRPECIELGTKFRYPVVEFADLVCLAGVRLEEILMFLVQVFELMLKSLDMLLLPLPKRALRGSILSAPPLLDISPCVKRLTRGEHEPNACWELYPCPWLW